MWGFLPHINCTGERVTYESVPEVKCKEATVGLYSLGCQKSRQISHQAILYFDLGILKQKIFGSFWNEKYSLLLLECLTEVQVCSSNWLEHLEMKGSKYMSHHTFAEKTNKTKGKIGNENEVEGSAIFVTSLDYVYMPDFLRHFNFHNSHCWYCLILTFHIKKSCTFKKVSYSLAILRMKTLGVDPVWNAHVATKDGN